MPEVPGVPDDAAGLRAANARLRELLAERDERIAGQDAEIAVLREQLAGLQSQVADLAARVASNSRNSSKPPSSDGLARPSPKSLRGKSGRKPGRPKGQPGATMQLTDHPDKRVRHRPTRCGCCGKSLKRAAVTAVERRQVIDIPPVKAVTTEHQMLTLLCGCGHETKAEAPARVTAPVQYGPRIMGTGIYLWHGQFLSRDRACQALGELFGCAPSPGALASAAKKTAGLIAPALAAITRYLASAEAAHFDETGFRTAGRLAWVHSASWGKFVLVTVHAKRGKDGMTAAGVLPLFTGIAVHDAWKPYDSFDNVAGHALCGAHVLRELVAVTETGTDLDRAWARQAIDALLALDKAAEAARATAKNAMDPKTREEHEDWYRKAAAAGITLNAGRGSKLRQKRHALATRMQAREDDYLRFARDLRIPFTNNPAEQVIRMSKLRIKVSGCMRSMKGAETFCAIPPTSPPPPATTSPGSTPSPAPPRATPGSPAPPDTHPAAGVHSVPCPEARRASSISLSFAGDSAPARSIRSSRLRVVSQVHGVKPGRGNTSRSTPSKGSPSRTPTATSTPRPEMSAPAGATTCIARNPDSPSSDSSTTGRRSSNSTHQTSPRRMCPPEHEMAGKYYAGRRWK